MQIFKEIINNFWGRTKLYSLFSLRNKGYLLEMGWFESRKKGMPINAEGNPIPWITYPCLKFLEDRLPSGISVFEYGTGGSTLWWADRAEKVVTCEHDSVWYDRLSASLPANVKSNLVALEYGGDYCKKVLEYVDCFDVIFIDGRDRVNCVKNSLSALSRDGVLILDNSDVSEYEEALTFLAEKGFKRIDFPGPGPINIHPWRTSIFYNNDNVLGL
ncbi:hypothetical protein SAMN02744133_112135 [Thalassospira xiamenensis M-5 = DSM 17429]|nr:hypothetical protein SAMN02744133_112135 [Thalassospira xiamenensis M-5 = DSM 17429]